MVRLPRLALATPSRGPEPAPATLAILAGLTARDNRVQHFRSRACPIGSGLIGRVTGLPGRHLDAWLMPPEVCRAVFARGARRSDLALVEGTLENTLPSLEDAHLDRPGRLRPIAEALDLPTIAVVECRGRDGLHLPRLPEGVDAILLDGLERPEDYEPVRRAVHLVCKIPVVGAVEALPAVREALRAVPGGLLPSDDIVASLAASFLRWADLELLHALAEGRPFPVAPAEPSVRPGRRFRVAYAQDEAFGGYFPDTLETLEALGAELVEFSPLTDETLPEAIDLVIVGSGYPDHFADELAANYSLIAELRAHVCRGRRIYAEGGGMAYLGRLMVLGDREVPGAGILPIDAELRADPTAPTPVTRVLSRAGWLGPAGTVVRGYRSGRWRLRPAPELDDCPALSGTLTAQHDIVFRHQAVGSLMHLHLAALPQVVAAFAGTTRPTLTGPPSRR
ncbi:MAG TPA: cobyrinic acid a,c-diamide synthase [Isosphaeraceae bacterium]|jgi:cobyrinic acid a,c-diamide synthase